MIGRVINLARSPERWASIRRQADERGLPLERIEAVDARDPKALADNAALPSSGLRPGEIACFESHRKVWRQIAGGTAGFGLVLEDDVFLCADIVALLTEIEAQAAAAGLAIVKLNAHPRGILLRQAPLATPAGRRLLRPVQGTSDSSAYLIARDFAVTALAIHRGYRAPLDVALFDPATCPDIAQIDPAVTIQQRYADFAFLEEGTPHTEIQLPGTKRRPRPSPAEAVRREALRFWRRRVVPAAQPVLNLARPEAERVGFRRIRFQN